MLIDRDPALLDRHVDLVVVGGGITGVSVAREAAARGLSVVLLDKGDLGEGTSSATTKYLHGGIRYLETYEFGVVRESLRERRILALSAPHLVEQRRFVMPAWRWSRPPTALIGAGVLLYTALGFDRNRDVPPSMRMPAPRWLSRAAVLRDIPWLDPDGLQGAFAYHDTLNVHPERLLLAFALSAAEAGAVLRTHTEVTGFVTEPDPTATRNGSSSPAAVVVRGVAAVDRITGQRFEVRGRAVLNAAGPWMDLVLHRLGAPLGDRVGVRVNRSKGVHLLTRPVAGLADVRDTVFARARSGRHVIVSPWQGWSFIGPTDTPTPDEPDDLRADADDVESILDTVNSTIAPGFDRLTVDDIEATTVGVRPLIVEEGRDSYTTSRRHELYDHRDVGLHHLWSIGGGKWTTGRALAEETVDALLASSALAGVATRPYRSRTAPAAGSFGWAVDPAPFLAQAAAVRPALGVSPERAMHLARLYGTAYPDVLALVAGDPALAAPLSDRPGRLDIAAQAVYGVLHEGACTLADVVDRRLVLGTVGQVSRTELERVAQVVAPLWGWDAERTAAEVDAELDRRAARRARWLPSGERIA